MKAHLMSTWRRAGYTERALQEHLGRIVIVRASRKAIASALLALVWVAGESIAIIYLSGPLLLLALACGLGAFRLHQLAKRAIALSQGSLVQDQWTTRCRLVCYGLGLVLTLYVLPARYLIHQNAYHIEAGNNCREITQALHAYADEHNQRFPPPALRDKGGRPLLSWRVLILPYLEKKSLFEAFRLDEPWDSPHNLALVPQMPRAFQVSARKDQPFITPFQVFVGPGAAFEVGREMHKLDDFKQGQGGTVLFVEARQAVLWTKPEDLTYAPGQPLPPLGPVLTPWFGRQGREPFRIIVSNWDRSRPWFSNTPDGLAELQRAIPREGPVLPLPAR